MSDTTSPLRPFDGPRVDPRFRRRWAEARRAEGRRRLKILLSFLVAAAVVGACVGLLFSPVFRVRDVVVIGNTHTPRAEVLAAAGVAAGDRTVLMVDSGPPSARRALDSLPWVAGATFERRWPWTLVIRLTERSPVARRGCRRRRRLGGQERPGPRGEPVTGAHTASDHGGTRGGRGRLHFPWCGTEAS